MKTSTLASKQFLPPGKCEAGLALVLVLGAVTLVTVLVLAFFMSATREATSSKQYYEGIATQILADSTVQLVQAQIFDATLGSAASGDVWVSQPGLIRTYSQSGALAAGFKLYSAEKMQVGPTEFSPSMDLPPPDWHDHKAQWVDLNETAKNREGALVYPIADPRAEHNPTAADVKDLGVAGFVISDLAPEAPGNDANPLPMPVRWIYVMQDGQMAIANDDGDVNGASRTNPIIGRVAFWTDDESAKVNINTASEGVYWDVPLPLRVSGSGSNPTYGTEEVKMARSQPWNKEYQRYPGHPATTRLSPIFPELFPNGPTTPYLSFSSLYTLLPRVAPGGSKANYSGGSVLINATPGPTNLIKIRPDRLFASLDELVFNVARTGQAGVTEEMIQERAFMLTASSRSPDLNIFNQPKVSMWPTWQDPARRTSFDRLAAFASTIGGKTYYTTRSNPHSRNEDWTARNLQIYEYLDRMTSKTIPGFGASFANKYSNNASEDDRLQLLTQMIDYTRSGVNLVDTTSGAIPFAPGFDENGEDAMGYGMVVPLKHPTNSTWGLGRYAVIDEVGFWFFASSYDKVKYPELSGSPATGHFGEDNGAHAPATAMRAAILFSVANPARGMVPIFPAFDYEVQIIDPVSATPISGTGGGVLFSGGTLAGKFRGRNWGTVYSNEWKPEWGNWNTNRFDPNFLFIPRSAHGGADGSYPLLGNEVAIPTETQGVRNNYRFNFSGAKLKIRIKDPVSSEVVQELDVDFPAAVFNYPLIWNNKVTTLPNNWANRHTTLGSRLTEGVFKNSRYGHLLREGDTVKSMELFPYDPRLSVGKPKVEATDWRRMTAWGGAEIEMYSRSSTTYVQSMSMQGTEPCLRRQAHHFIRSGVSNFGVGFTGNISTGAYDVNLFGQLINKPDEGDSIQLQGGSIPYIDGGQNTGAQDREVSYGKSSLFSPNRQVASPVMFGSLPTRAASGIPNQTLLFHPKSITNIKLRANNDHPGGANPPDHLMLDLFHMPVVEPYAISEPFSTAGRINLNHQIYPFSYIQRDTGLRAVLGAVKITGVPANIGGNTGLSSARYDINIADTLQELANYKNTLTARGPDAPFLTASEICEIPLVPLGQNGAPYPGGYIGFWRVNSQTGGGYGSNDDWKEAPYNMLYPRLTTRSNTFQVHMRVQSLQKVPGTDPGKWVERRDRTTGEYRGSVVLERYLDPNDRRFTDGSIDPDTESVDPAYRFRTVHSKIFSP